MLCYLFIGLVHKYPHFFEKKKKNSFVFKQFAPLVLIVAPIETYPIFFEMKHMLMLKCL